MRRFAFGIKKEGRRRSAEARDMSARRPLVDPVSGQPMPATDFLMPVREAPPSAPLPNIFASITPAEALSGAIVPDAPVASNENPEALAARKHAERCESDLMYALFFSDDAGEERLRSHVNGLVAPADAPEPGLLQQLNNGWSREVRQFFVAMERVEEDEILGDPDARADRVVARTAVLLAALPHLDAFESYVASRSADRGDLNQFIEGIVMDLEASFYFYGCSSPRDLAGYVANVRALYAATARVALA